MSQGLNRVMLLGNLGADPELRYTQKGGAVLNLRLATNESWVDKSTKDVQERTEWHRITVWGNHGEALSRFLKKGDCVMVEGRLQTTSYEKDGVKHYSTDIVARSVYLTGRRSTAGLPAVLDTAEEEGMDAPPSLANGKNGAPRPEAVADDIPF